MCVCVCVCVSGKNVNNRGAILLQISIRGTYLVLIISGINIRVRVLVSGVRGY